MKFTNKLLLALMAVTLVFAVSCSQKDEEATESASAESAAPAEEKTAELVYVNWAEGVAYTNLAKVVLEDKMGYDVTITATDVAPGYVSIAQGDKDAFMETWLPVLHKDYYDEYKDDIVDLGHVFEGTQSGLVVPAYMSIDKISELNSIKDDLGGKITGIDAGAGVMKTTEEVIDLYDLELSLMSSSGPAMAAALKDAYAKKEPIVVTGWTPHWMFGKWDLKFLQQDPDKTVWGKGNIHIMARKNIREDKPTLATFLSNMFFDEAQLGDLMVKIEESDDDIEVVARQWMNDHSDLIDSWIP
ncbi:glycine betaine ABC transporter substrate-binding protein [Sediminispirochaeta bajacaliforniensis]|uniref:glycine betaine ABC transporter substrate-binding protein n=1 Tax=Sediminispirochaeta bajacaliforniensis TaxID=148 RepID=UPI00047797E4|nr:glycine betaine ABC transporter substrate-binding protein [Sediminispirochaeta bajacaliforniensis]